MLGEAEALQECHLVVIDIDQFKKLNERWSIEAGDRTLTELAYMLNSTLRVNDTAARYQGGSFVVLLTGLGHDACLAVLDRIRVQFCEQETAMEDGTLVPHTFCAGMTTADSGETIAEMMEGAEKALAVAKAEGRNRVVSERRLNPKAAGVSPAGLT
jgi:diguanylate cyclase (GGDEF)-like protein